MRKSAFLFVLAAVVACAANAQAALLGYEGFDGYTVGATPGGQTGSGNLGFSGAYSGTGHTVQAGTLSYTNGLPLVTSPGSLKSTGFGNLTRPLAAALSTQSSTGEELWVSYLFKAGPNTEDANVLRFFYGPSGGDGQRIDINVTRPGSTQELQTGAWFVNSPNSSGAPFYPNGEVNLVLLQYTLDDVAAGNQGVMRAYLNPAIGGAAPAIGSALVTQTGLGGFDNPDNLRLFSFGGGDWAVTWDEIRWGSTFADVTPVIPEPASIALAGLAAVGIGARRRRA